MVMTFEEFIAKKKIDLTQFKSAEASLFAEFESHYNQMGPKSFDHSKKFLFNRLRRAYHLKEEAKAVVPPEVIEVNEIASQAEPLLSPTVEATVYTPRFRGGVTKTEETSSGSEIPKPAYKPRFKAPNAQPVTDTTNSDPAPEAKPAFKPRFKPGLTTVKAASTTDVPQKEDIPVKPKPAYVPRFKAQVKPVSESEDQTSKIVNPPLSAEPVKEADKEDSEEN